MTALFAIALAAPEPPVGENTMEGLNLDPELLARVAEILAGSGSGSGRGSRNGGSRSSSYNAPSRSGNGYPARSGSNEGQSNFELGEIQPAPLVADFNFEGANNNGGQSRSGSYNAPSRSYSAPSANGYSN